MRFHKIFEQIYGATVYLFLEGSPQEIEAKLNRVLKTSQPIDIADDIMPGAIGFATQLSQYVTNDTIYVVWIKEADNRILAHECFHLVCRIFRDRCIKLDFTEVGNEEHFAYYLDSMISGLGVYMRPTIKKKKKGAKENDKKTATKRTGK